MGSVDELRYLFVMDMLRDALLTDGVRGRAILKSNMNEVFEWMLEATIGDSKRGRLCSSPESN
jgi:hypothetical protein